MVDNSSRTNIDRNYQKNNMTMDSILNKFIDIETYKFQ